jgi:hypothetical protein
MRRVYIAIYDDVEGTGNDEDELHEFLIEKMRAHRGHEGERAEKDD